MSERERVRESMSEKEEPEKPKSYQGKKIAGSACLRWTTVFVLSSRTSKRRGYTFPSIKPMDPAKLGYKLKSVPRILNQDEREREFDFVLIVLIHLESAACSENENKGAFQRNKISTMILKKKVFQVNS